MQGIVSANYWVESQQMTVAASVPELGNLAMIAGYNTLLRDSSLVGGDSGEPVLNYFIVANRSWISR